ncbi:MAG TPA: hypothetical protein VMV10_01140 [Pirellulales bacterium]|nr:hypothetical protein [Pirellulales bacterium]
MIELSPELQQALDAQAETPPRIVDPRTNKAYVLLAAEQYERIKALLEQEDDLAQTYPAQMESAMRAGWGDAAMDDYDRYDELRR